jgi:outer membrane protein assembly factor BamB
MKTRSLLLLAAGLGSAAALASAADWPQWRGPQRDGSSPETGLLKEWPKDGPKQLWKNGEIGGGFSTPSVVAGRVYLLGDKDKEEYLIALDAKDGSEQWRAKLGPVGKDGPPSYPGPRSTPTVDGDRVFALGSGGDLVCVEKAKGEVKWKKNLKADFAGQPGMWAYAESPLIDGDVLVCTPGGKESTLIGLDKKTGEPVWKCAVPDGDFAAYASVIAVEAGGVRQYVQFLGKELVGVEAKTGKFLWRYDKTKDPAANIPTAVSHDGCVFTSTARNGSGLIRLKADKDKGDVSTEEVYYNKTALSSTGGAVRVGDYLYGTNAKGELVCMEFKTGEVKWHDPSVGAGSLCSADGLLYVRGQGGDGFGPEKPARTALVEATPDGYKEKGRFEQPEHGNRPAWPHPVVADGKLYLRDQGVLFCYDVKDPNAGK